MNKVFMIKNGKVCDGREIFRGNSFPDVGHPMSVAVETVNKRKSISVHFLPEACDVQVYFGTRIKK